MVTYKTFLDGNGRLKELLEIYLELRLHFQELGFSEKQLEKPPVHTNKMMKLFHMFGDYQKALFQQVKNYGLDITWKEFTDYIEPLLKKINELTPLAEYGNQEGTDSWDEDSE